MPRQWGEMDTAFALTDRERDRGSDAMNPETAGLSFRHRNVDGDAKSIGRFLSRRHKVGAASRHCANATLLYQLLQHAMNGGLTHAQSSGQLPHRWKPAPLLSLGAVELREQILHHPLARAQSSLLVFRSRWHLRFRNHVDIL